MAARVLYACLPIDGYGCSARSCRDFHFWTLDLFEEFDSACFVAIFAMLLSLGSAVDPSLTFRFAISPSSLPRSLMMLCLGRASKIYEELYAL